MGKHPPQLHPTQTFGKSMTLTELLKRSWLSVSCPMLAKVMNMRSSEMRCKVWKRLMHQLTKI
eukprot:6333989-Amphidinium_carterae.1